MPKIGKFVYIFLFAQIHTPMDPKLSDAHGTLIILWGSMASDTSKHLHINLYTKFRHKFGLDQVRH